MTRPADGHQQRRRTLQLLGAGGLLAVAALATAGVFGAFDREAGVGVPLAAALAACVLGTGVALVLPQTRRISEQVLATCAVLAGLAGLVLVCAVAEVLLLGRVPDGSERALFGPSLVALALVALLSGPVARAVRRSSRGGWRGGSQTPQEVLDAFVTRGPVRPASGDGEDELLRQLAEALSRTLAARQVEIWTESPEGLRRVLSLPERALAPDALRPAEVDVLARTDVAGAAWLRLWLPHLLAGRSPEIRLAPALQSRAVLGLLVVERSPSDPPFGAADEQLLAEVAGRLATVLHNRELDSALRATLLDLQRTNAELRASRARLVATADRERRRLERDLHDGAQQHLVALAVNLGLARQLIDDDPVAAHELLDESADAVRETVQQLRDLAHGIYPPLLMDSGLGEAMRAASARSPLPVRVQVDGIGRYSTEIEAAVYFCCLEALQNAAKHAPDAQVQMRLAQSRSADGSPQLTFEVSDDGPGLAATAGATAGRSSGQGLQNMADRLGAVGGSVVWDEAPGGGTRVSGAIPLTTTEDAPRAPEVAGNARP